MTSVLVECGACRVALEPVNTRGISSACPVCGAAFEMVVFPSLFEPLAAGTAGERLLTDTESSCYYHTQKKAVIACDGCGRFLCALCDVELGDSHLCPACIEAGAKGGAMAKLESRRTRYDNIALMLAVIPLILVYPTLLTAPAALFMSIRYWNAPSSIKGRLGTRVRMSIALLVSALEIVGWVALFGALIVGAFR
ncbi:MAG: hypothetical protein HZB26_01095 [Candidatus Hydrogenedentes bacterium]|nr:hypothetical protein [Candidatus Hydrogenedentota bacterium]